MSNKNNSIKIGATCWQWIDADWRQPPTTLALSKHDAHIWWFPLDATCIPLNKWRNMLSPEEAQRFGGMTSEKRRREYVAGHVLTRCLVARYQNMPVHEVRLHHTNSGKPYLPSTQPLPICVSASHSNEILLIVLSRRNVGIDVEQKRRAEDYPRVARRMCPHLKDSGIKHVKDNPEEASLLFTRYWTCCESLHKLMGHGLLHNADAANTTATKKYWGRCFSVGENATAALCASSACNLVLYAGQAFMRLSVASTNNE